MSSKIYICKNCLNTTVRVSGYEVNNTLTFSNDALKDYGYGGTQYSPNIINVRKTVEDSIEVTSNLDASLDDPSTRITNLKLFLYCNVAPSTFLPSDFNVTYKDKIYLHYNVTIHYDKGDLSTITSKKEILVPGSLITLGYKSYIASVEIENFMNVYGYGYPLKHISIDTTESPAISFIDGSIMTTAEAIYILKTTTNINPTKLTLTKKRASPYPPDAYIANFTVPDSARTGKLFVTNFSVKELPKHYCLYRYLGKIGPSIMLPTTLYLEPSSSVFFRYLQTVHDVYEYHNGKSRMPLEYDVDMVGFVNDSISSSFDDYEARVVDYYTGDNIGTWSSFPTGVPTEVLNKTAWLDGVYIGIYFHYSGTSKWYSLYKCIKEGIPVPEGNTQISVALALPDLCTLTMNSFTNDTQGCYPDEYAGGFYPYNSLEVDLSIGYQTDCTSLNGAINKHGMYIGTNKLRRMIVDNDKEIEYFIVDSEDSVNGTIDVSGLTGKIGLKDETSPNTTRVYYLATGSVTVPGTVQSATIYSSEAQASVSFEGGTLNWKIYSTTKEKLVEGKITYTY